MPDSDDSPGTPLLSNPRLWLAKNEGTDAYSSLYITHYSSIVVSILFSLPSFPPDQGPESSKAASV